MKRLAIGIDDFRKIIKEDCYYVDKTKFIADNFNFIKKYKI